MTRAQSVDVVNDSTTMQSRIDTVLATPDLDWANDSGWHPGDPLYAWPGNYVRPLFEVLDEAEPYVRCEPCGVSWGRAGGDACWNCGTECPLPPGVLLGPFAAFDEAHEWSRASLRPFIEAMADFSRQMAQASISMEQFRQRYTVGFDGRGRSEYAALVFSLADPEPELEPETWIRSNSRCYLLPHIENVNAPTVSEIAEGEPLAEWERELLGLPDPVIRIPAGAEITPVAPVPLPESIDTALLGGRRRPEIRRHYFNRPVTETRRTS